MAEWYIYAVLWVMRLFPLPLLFPFWFPLLRTPLPPPLKFPELPLPANQLTMMLDTRWVIESHFQFALGAVLSSASPFLFPFPSPVIMIAVSISIILTAISAAIAVSNISIAIALAVVAWLKGGYGW